MSENPDRKTIIDSLADKMGQGVQDAGLGGSQGGVDALGNKVRQPTNTVSSDDNSDSFHLDALQSMNSVSKTITEGHVSAVFQSIPGKTSFEIDNDTDATVIGVVTNNTKKGFRYCCAAIQGYSIKSSYTDLMGKNWKDKELIIEALPTILINKLMRMHQRFEAEFNKLFDSEVLKNS
jgi:hypothetical protein